MWWIVCPEGLNLQYNINININLENKYIYIYIYTYTYALKSLALEAPRLYCLGTWTLIVPTSAVKILKST